MKTLIDSGSFMAIWAAEIMACSVSMELIERSAEWWDTFSSALGANADSSGAAWGVSRCARAAPRKIGRKYIAIVPSLSECDRRWTG